MKITLFLISFFPLLLLADPYTPKKLPDERMIENFTTESPGRFPEGFRTYPFQRGKAVTVYSVQSEGNNHHLNATVRENTQGIAVQIFKRFYWDLSRWSNLSWRWRAKALPRPPTGTKERFDDNACGVYVVFGGYGGKAIKFVWSTDLPPGTVLEDTPGRFTIIVASSGPKEIGRWQKRSFNIVDEYRRAFGSIPHKDPAGIGILTDGDQTRSPAVCDYDDFEIKK